MASLVPAAVLLHFLSLSCCWLLCWREHPQADLLLLLLLQEARAQVCAGVAQHSRNVLIQKDQALSGIATTQIPQTAGIGSLPGIGNVSDDIMDISLPAQSGQALGAASHAKQAGAMTTGLPTTAGMLAAATGELVEVSMQEETDISVTTMAAKAPLMEDNMGEVLTAAESAFINTADAGGHGPDAEAQQGQAAEAPADPLAPHSIFAADDLISRHPGDFPAAAKAMQSPQVSPLGSPAGGRQVQDAAKDVHSSPTTPLEWAGKSVGSAGSSPTAPAPEGEQLAGFRSTGR